MAKIKIAGNVASVQMEVEAPVVNRVQKFCPDAMKLVNASGKTDFIVAVGDKACGDSIGAYGFEASSVAKSINKYSVPVVLVNEVSDAKAAVTEMFGDAIIKINEVEAQILEVADEATRLEKLVEDAVEVVE